ncbi:hypothetical protein Y032_0343g3066 [Ancylostoma ceylanicum]|uniref:Uncharacterized protein n=1 Tax=Ancylostoma ceylanicum TaxID=53326 RepID=A0A016RYP9_9BILA|nr:hypothetical protein Y032_0343g3066 [Ancylostoma ceylanicum]
MEQRPITVHDVGKIIASRPLAGATQIRHTSSFFNKKVINGMRWRSVRGRVARTNANYPIAITVCACIHYGTIAFERLAWTPRRSMNTPRRNACTTEILPCSIQLCRLQRSQPGCRTQEMDEDKESEGKMYVRFLYSLR